MANLVNDRDAPLVNGLVCPKRMGDHLARVVFDTFVAAPHSPTLSIYDEMFGISLVSILNTWFDNYELGLRFVSTNQYECYSFVSLPPNQICTIIGTHPLPHSTWA
ncbi:hypothetical protein BC827DRAFT_891094 [Russula dissimulans]|nr:hypothetical protein BC827DRAFT_891094 [Russula dissimulans]